MSNLFMASCSDHYIDDMVWLVDNGCSNHIISEKKLFTHLDETHKHKVRLGDDQELLIERLGMVALKVGDGGVRLLHEV